MMLQPRPSKQNARKSILVDINPAESFWAFMLMGIGLGFMAAWTMESYLAFIETLGVVMILYCALCLAELVRAIRNESI